MTGIYRRSPGRPPFKDREGPTDALILQHAMTLFLQEGYQKVSVDQIAEACGVTKATVYYYFQTKAELFLAAITMMMKQIGGRIAEMLDNDKPLKVRLYEVTLAHLQATYDIDLSGFLRETKDILTEDQIEEMKNAEQMILAPIEEAVTQAVEAGELMAVSPVFAARIYMVLLEAGSDEGHIKGLFPTAEEAAKHIVDFVWRGLGLE